MLAPRSAKLFEDEQRFVFAWHLLAGVVVLLVSVARPSSWMDTVIKKNQIALNKPQVNRPMMNLL